MTREEMWSAGDTCTQEWSTSRVPLGLILTAMVLAGCVGMAADLPMGEVEPDEQGERGEPGGARPEVTLSAAPPRLLPFDVRLERAASAVGVPVDDSVFNAARDRRLSLGAHDFANGTAPDLQWNSQRIAVWIEAMIPVCSDARVRSNFGSWTGGGVEKFTQNAFGRPSTAEDLGDLSPTLAMPADTGWLATCLALTSSAEMVLQ